ncbi:hypothetical protein EV356DRAFT_246951 [Viridothelium virens]|uniref:Uncharacterized protein n=1 Tax=Viridothelium virens TaxID=1048519 RepID=A0A6A6H517_VIRVR|nr:hypothetical protein EV356DRAFT_246951 [Viridothelium virens]
MTPSSLRHSDTVPHLRNLAFSYAFWKLIAPVSNANIFTMKGQRNQSNASKIAD